MPFAIPILRVISIVALALGLSACPGGEGCPLPTELEGAAHYRYLSSPGGGGRFSEPPNSWTEQPRMAAFVRKVLDEGGTGHLVSKYGFDCKPRADAACADCRTCTNRVPTSYSRFWGLRLVCHVNGEVFVRADVGPGPALQVMTFWKMPDPDDH